MKAEYEVIMAKAVASQLSKAEGLGIKASWSTGHHLNAVADVLAEHGQNREGALSVLTDCYNVSAFQQMLAKKFAPTGHFQREGKKSSAEAVDSFLKMVEAAKAPAQG